MPLHHIGTCVSRAPKNLNKVLNGIWRDPNLAQCSSDFLTLPAKSAEEKGFFASLASVWTVDNSGMNHTDVNGLCALAHSQMIFV